jgi:hypothetical protein
MSSIGITSIPISGYNRLPVPNRFFKHEHSTGLAMIFPGLRYPCDMPLLYYLTQVFLNHDLDVLQLHTDYTTEPIKSLSPTERLQTMGSDAQAALEAIYPNGDYPILVIAGKSIGTLQLAMLLSSAVPADLACIWLTPLLHYPTVVDAALQHAGAALFIASRADETFEPESMEQIQSQPNNQTLLIEEADHSLLIPGNTLRSVEILGQVVQSYFSFVRGLYN